MPLTCAIISANYALASWESAADLALSACADWEPTAITSDLAGGSPPRLILPVSQDGQPGRVGFVTPADPSGCFSVWVCRLQVMLAWGLVMQHNCWCQFACALLVRSSLHHLQQQQQAQDYLSSATQQLQQLLQLPKQQLQGTLRLPCSQAAAAAAAFIAWIHQPIDHERWAQA